MRLPVIAALACACSLALGTPLSVQHWIGSLRSGAWDADIHPSGLYAAVTTSGGTYQIGLTDTGITHYRPPTVSGQTPHRVRYSPDGFWAAVSYGYGNVDIYRTPAWDFYARIEHNNHQLGYAEFDGVSRHIGVEGGSIFRMSDLQPMSFQFNGSPADYRFETFAGLQSIIRDQIWGSFWVVHTENMNTTTGFSTGLDAYASPYIGSGVSGIFTYSASVYWRGFARYDTVARQITQTVVRQDIRSGRFRMSHDGRFLVFDEPFATNPTLGIRGLNPEDFTFDDHFGYSGNTPGQPFGAIHSPPGAQLGDVRVLSGTNGGDVHLLRMPDKVKLADLTPHVGGVPLVTTSPTNPRRMATGGTDRPGQFKGILIWNIPEVGTATVAQRLEAEDDLRGLRYTPGGSRLLALYADRLEVWDPSGSTSTPVTVVPLPGVNASGLDVCRTHAIAYNNQYLRTIELGTWAVSGSLENWGEARISPDGTKVAHPFSNGGVVVRDRATWQILRQYSFPFGRWINDIQWHPNGTEVAVSSSNDLGGYQYDHWLNVYPLSKAPGAVARERNTAAWGRARLRYSNDGSALAAPISQTSHVLFFDTKHYRVAQSAQEDRLENHWSPPGRIAFTQDDRQIVLIDERGPILVVRNPARPKGK